MIVKIFREEVKIGDVYIKHWHRDTALYIV